MADAIEIYLDLSTPQGALVKGLSDKSPAVLGPFYQGAALNFRIFPVTPTGANITAPFFAKVALDALDFELVLGPRAGATAILAANYAGGWTKQNVPDADGKSGYWYATLDLDVAGVNTALATADNISSYLEFRLSRSSAHFSPVCQVLVTLLSSVKDPTGIASVPTPTPSYLTRDECLSLFVAWRNDLIAANVGRNLVLASPNALHTRELGSADDGSPIDNQT